MTAREYIAPLAARLRTALADEKQRVNLLVLMGLAGLVLLAFSAWLPADDAAQPAPAAVQETAADYAAQLESRLTALIRRVDGAGNTAVMVTLESGSESVYATDTDRDGGSTHVLLGSGGADGLVETVQTPRVLGVAVVCEGGGTAAVQNRVTALVEALTGVGANHITVARWHRPTKRRANHEATYSQAEKPRRYSRRPDTGAGGRRISELVLLPRGTAQPACIRYHCRCGGDCRRCPCHRPTGRRSRCGRRGHRDLRR